MSGYWLQKITLPICEWDDCQFRAYRLVRFGRFSHGSFCVSHAEGRINQLEPEHAEHLRGMELIREAEADVDPHGILVGRALSRVTARVLRKWARRAVVPAERKMLRGLAEAMESLHKRSPGEDDDTTT